MSHHLKKTSVLSLIAATLLTGCTPQVAPFLGSIANEYGKTSTSCNLSTGGSGTASGLIATGTAEELTEEQNKNAQLILGEVKARGLGHKEAVIAIITALVESNLINVAYGDDIHGVTNPDGTPTSSLGLFQQQKWWGSREDRLNPQKATGFFLDALLKINYQDMQPGAAAQAVQVSAFPDKYQLRVAEAEDIIAKVGIDFTQSGSGTSSSDKEDSKDNDKDKSKAQKIAYNTSGCSSSSTSKGGVGSGSAGQGDDYPLRASQAAIDGGYDDLTPDPWGLYVGQCVSYVAWRINVQMGWKEGQGYPFTMAKMEMAGQGNGFQWSPQLAEVGYVTDKNPKKGAIAWWDSYANEYVGSAGHVAIVESYDLDAGTVTVSQYNMLPNNLRYSEHTFPIDKISGFIHVADLED